MKFNNTLLGDPEYVKVIKETIQNIQNTVNIENKNTLWEYEKYPAHSFRTAHIFQLFSYKYSIIIAILDFLKIG